jgi:hypothetical protein
MEWNSHSILDNIKCCLPSSPQKCKIREKERQLRRTGDMGSMASGRAIVGLM